MKVKKTYWQKPISLGIVSLGFVQALHAATVITSEGATGNAVHGNNSAPSDTLGSNATSSTVDITVTGGGTPDIGVFLNPVGTGGWEYYNWNGNGGSLQLDGENPASFIFTPAAGIATVVTSADFDFWSAKDGWTVDWSVVGSGSTNVSGTFTSSLAQRRETVNFNVTGAAGEVLTLTIDQTHGNYAASFAIDNLTFDQIAVPEPSSTALVGLGLGAMAMRRRRK